MRTTYAFAPIHIWSPPTRYAGNISRILAHTCSVWHVLLHQLVFLSQIRPGSAKLKLTWVFAEDGIDDTIIPPFLGSGQDRLRLKVE